MNLGWILLGIQFTQISQENEILTIAKEATKKKPGRIESDLI